MNNYIEWFKKNKITEVECLIPDNSGIPRGKILPTKKFLSSTSKNVQVCGPENVQLQKCTTMCHVVVLQRAMCVGTLGSTKQKPIYEKENLN